MAARRSPVPPFLKWPGGKRWLTQTLIDYVRHFDIKTYYEPFLGGGALFFALLPSRAVLSDINPDLINTYRQVKNNPRDLVERIRALPVNKRTYDRLRKQVGGRVLDRAVRFLYLNRTAFAGMYRLNRQGEFNVPFGGGERTPAPLWEAGLIADAAKALRYCELRTSDFEDPLAEARSGDLVYCDPTYTVAHNNNGFIRYNEKNFSWADQKRLAGCCQDAAHRGAMVIVSNALHPEVFELFAPPVYSVVTRSSRLCPQPEHRMPAEEYLFVFPPKLKSSKCVGSGQRVLPDLHRSRMPLEPT